MTLDVVSFGETMFRLTAHAVRLEHAPALQVYVGGTESNTLASLARLNFKVSWLSALPANPLGKHVETELRRHGVDTSSVVWSAGTSRLGTFYVEESPDPLGLQVYYDRANSACALVEPDAVNYGVVDAARVLHLTGITPALSVSAREIFSRFLARARVHNVPLSFDVNYRARLCSASTAAGYVEEACQQAQILFCSYADAASLWGFTGTPVEVLRQMARRFNAASTLKTLVLTLGSAGSAHLHNNEYLHAPAIPTAGTVRFGSGDAFDAGYLYASLDGPLYKDLRSQSDISPLTFGNALASLKRCIQGDIAVITPEDVKNLLQKQEGRRFR